MAYYDNVLLYGRSTYAIIFVIVYIVAKEKNDERISDCKKAFEAVLQRRHNIIKSSFNIMTVVIDAGGKGPATYCSNSSSQKEDCLT